MAASSSSAAANVNNKSFDVFINHRGVDTKKTFAKWLYRGLRTNGLTAFIDFEEMRQGYDISSQIEDAVRSASVHVAVFSPRYAESVWCLQELVLMSESKAPIIPVFYRVTPGEVRWTTTGKYAEDLQNLEKKRRYDSNTIKMWKRALHEVATRSGFEMHAFKGEQELELMPDLVDDVVKSVLEIVKNLKLQAAMPNLHVAEYPTGLDYKLKDFKEKVLLPQQESGKPQIFGIVGVEGVGKTALAKHFFNSKKSEYVASCFLFEVKATKLELLQTEILMSLIGTGQPVDNVHKRKGMLMDSLKSRKALVILDDVDDMEQVKALLPVHTHELCSGSLILITSRNRDVLRTRVDALSIYTLTGLETQHSRGLFCSHAFSQAYPLPGFENMVDQFLKSCYGLPSFLTEFGTLLRGKDIFVWKDELENLPRKIKEYLLQISYDTLHTEEQHIFLDIACVFIGQNRETAISIWNGSGWTRSRQGLQSLQDKSFVEMDRWNNIQMPDHLRDLGRDIAASSSPARLWHTGTKSVIDNLSQQSAVREITVRAILMNSEYNGHYKDDVFDFDDSQKVLFERILWRVQILDTKGFLLEPILKRLELPNLIWLRWENCPYSSLPSWVPIKNLRVLRVANSLLKTLCGGQDEPQVGVDNLIKNSRIIQVASSLLRTLWGGKDEWAPLQLPVCLEEFWADGSVQLKSIRELEHSTKLRVLNVGGCSKLEQLPSMETLVCLEELWVDGCVQLKSIPGLAKCTKLRQLNVSRCSALKELPRMETLVSLKALWADGCVQLKSIRGLAQCTKLRLLNIRGCSELEELPSMETLVSLEELKADGCVQLKSIRGLQQSANLQVLLVSGCVQLKSIRGLQQSKKLRELDVSMCSELEDLQIMETLVSLEKFRADGCVQMKNILGLAQCTKLRLLSVNECFELEELPSMETLASLEELLADECVQLKSVRGLAHCTNLQKLNVSGCCVLEELPSMESLVSLEELLAVGCVRLKSIRGLAQCTKLQILTVGGCSELEELPSMETLVSLENLWVDECVQLKSIQGLAQCTKLRKLIFTGCFDLEELPSMETLIYLESLCVDGCVQLKRIRGLNQCTKLQKLYVTGCSELEELPNMETLLSLEVLLVVGCVRLKSIRGLAKCSNLKVLIAPGCYELEEVEGLEGLEYISLDETALEISRNIERWRTARSCEIHFDLHIR